jgi:polyribonucleotide nucleotidyltransferase
MLNVVKVQREIAGRTLTIETGKIARQADGAVMVTYGETVVLVTAVTGPPRFEDIDFFPLSVEYRERHSAAGKFPGGFIKREGRPSTKEILTARMIDRPIRPMFPDGYFQEVQIIATVMSADQENDPDVPAMIGASAALHISKIPFEGPTAACRLGRINGEFVVNPLHSQEDQSELNLLLGGQKDAINMIEIQAQELSEETVADAIQTAHETVQTICEMIDELRSKVGVEKVIPEDALSEDLVNEVKQRYTERIRQCKDITDKKKRYAAMDEVLEAAITDLVPAPDAEVAQGAPVVTKALVKRAFGKVEKQVVRDIILKEGKRVDGRGFDEIRPIECEVGVLPRTHGSALFTRGETQALVCVTLGTIRDGQIIDGLQEEYSQTFTLHYNFPPYSVGEARMIRGVSRREIGHGALAERALEPMRPKTEDFAYTIRILSDITESNGSSSMASVCGGSLALMDTGVPIARPVAGISIGLVTGDDGQSVVLTDILGEEDHFGDMDFKIAGTTKGITAIQLDIKSSGLPRPIMLESLERARNARGKILETMNRTLAAPRSELSTYAPKLISIQIDPEFIGKVIGPSGKMIKGIQEETGTTIEIEDDGTIFISSVGGDGHLKAKEIIEAITSPPEVGRLYPKSKVVAVKDFGVFVELVPGIEGLCHISELDEGYVKNVESVCKLGDIIPVKLISIDDQGRLKLSRKAAQAEMKANSGDSEA